MDGSTLQALRTTSPVRSYHSDHEFYRYRRLTPAARSSQYYMEHQCHLDRAMFSMRELFQIGGVAIVFQSLVDS